MISLARDNRNNSFAKSTITAQSHNNCQIPIVRLVKYCVQRTNDSESGLKRKYCEESEAYDDETGIYLISNFLVLISILYLIIHLKF